MKKYSISISGAAGQGIETVASFLATILKMSGYNVFVWREFMSRIRGGINSIQVRVSEERLGAFSEQSDIAIVLTKGGFEHLAKYSRTSENTIVLGEEEMLDGVDHPSSRIKIVPFTQLAKDIGSALYSNTVAAGVAAACFDVSSETVKSYLKERFGDKGEDVVERNVQAYKRGLQIGEEIFSDFGKSGVPADGCIEPHLILSGTDAVGLGALAGGCNFISSYPMSPSTGVLTMLAQQAKDFGIVVDQAEDEIAAMNKGIGAWYAGARAMVTTSGGGFALMTEGLSLAGMLESPMVVHLAQRPGPATGLPTRTAQEDLKHILGAAHGEFPRVVYAPGTYEEAFTLTQRAFNIADKYQVPVFVLTDQFMLDSSGNVPELDLNSAKVEHQFVSTGAGYQRYKLTDNGLSPRGLPGHGEGVVVADSDEHDESGHITEDLHLRVKMVEKRLGKLELLRDDALEPTRVGPKDASTVIVAWGSNFHVVKEALSDLHNDDIALLHFGQVYPLHRKTAGILEDANRALLVENNATGQFSDVILRETGYRIEEGNRLLKYNGLPFSVEEVTQFVRGLEERRSGR
jgi:2-oxoglutarate ferredoxin oxidoreductase subunit alpha